MSAKDFLPADDAARRQQLIVKIHDECESALCTDEYDREPTRRVIYWSLLQVVDIAGLESILERLQRDNEDQLDLPYTRSHCVADEIADLATTCEFHRYNPKCL